MPHSFNCLDCKASSKCFQKLVPSELEFIREKKTHISYKKGENICKQGAFASYVIYIYDGLVKLYLENIEDKSTNIKILSSSEFIGFSSIFGNNIYNFSVVAMRDSEVCLIEKDGLSKLLMNNGKFASEIIKEFCDTEMHLYSILKSISYKQMHGRLADTLLYLDSLKQKDTNIFNYISRKDIADFACISTESAVKLLTEFKNDKLISLNGKNIDIVNPKLLEDISKRG